MPWLATAVPYLGGNVPLGGPGEGIAGYLLGYGPLGVVTVILAWVLYRGIFVTSKSADKALADAAGRERERAGEWKALYLDEVTGHQKTRDALALANSRAESAAQETAAITRSLVESATRRDRERLRPGKAPP